MKIHPVGAELFMWTDRQMDRQTRWSRWSLFTILQIHKKN